MSGTPRARSAASARNWIRKWSGFARKLDGTYAYVQLDATFVKARQEHRVVSMAVVIAVGVNQDGQREVLGLDVGASEDGAFWHALLRSLVAVA